MFLNLSSLFIIKSANFSLVPDQNLGASFFIFQIKELLGSINITLVAIPIRVVPSSLTLQVLSFLLVLSAHTSTSPELKHKLGFSAEDFKNFFKVVAQPLG